MELSTLSSIIVILIIIVGVYLVYTDQVEGKIKLILIVFLAFLAIFILSNLSLFKSYKNVLDSPKAANSEIVYQASKLPVVTATFSLSIWIYIQDWNSGFGNTKSVMYYVRDGGNPTTMVLDSYDNNLIINYDVKTNNQTQTKTNTITIPNINIQKWVNITVCFDTNNTDTYINGKLTDTQIHNEPLFVPSNQGDITLCKGNTGFSGQISNARYYNKIVSPQEAWDIYKAGFSSNLLGNLLNRYNAAFTFYQDNNVVGNYILM
jgi:hypothetical protein